MAGAGYKLFNTGDVLTAAQVNTYLMEQTVMVFASAAARTTALTGVVSEGMLSYLKDTNAVEVYNGSAWVSSDDPNAIQNTIVDAKGDLITATAADTPARLAVGANDLLLTAASGETTGLKYTGAWTLFTPTWTGITVGNATNVARHCQIGKIVLVKINFTFGSTTSVTGNVSVAHPIATTAYLGGYQTGVRLLDAGTQFYLGFSAITTSAAEILISNVASTYPTLTQLSSTVPFTWTTNDEIQLSYWYEVA